MLLTSLTRFCLEHRIQGERDDDLYREAMRVLGAATGEHRVDIGDLQILFWSDSREGDAFLSGALGAVADCWSYRNSPTVRAWLDRLEAGDRGIHPQAGGAFHVLGLAQSDSSPVIQFWITDTFEGLADRVRAFWDDLRFAPGSQLSSAAIRAPRAAPILSMPDITDDQDVTFPAPNRPHPCNPHRTFMPACPRWNPTGTRRGDACGAESRA
jgi:hypothetical protein